MPRTRTAGLGPGALRMGGAGMRPRRPPTPFAPGGAGIAGAGAPTPGVGPSTPPPAGLMGAGGMKKGGKVEHKKEHHKEEHKKYARGGHVESEREEKREEMREKKEERHEKLARGGPVGAHIAGHTTHGMRGHPHPVEQGITKGLDKHRSSGPKGADSRTHRPHAGKVS